MRETYITIYIEEIKDTYKYWKKKKLNKYYSTFELWKIETNICNLKSITSSQNFIKALSKLVFKLLHLL